MSKGAQSEEWPVLFHKAAGPLEKLHLMLHAGKSKGLLLVLQGMETAGKDGSICSVFSYVSPLGVRAEAFGVPSAEGLGHDLFLAELPELRATPLRRLLALVKPPNAPTAAPRRLSLRPVKSWCAGL